MSILIVTPVALKVPPRGGPTMNRLSSFVLGLIEATSNFLDCANKHAIAPEKRMIRRSTFLSVTPRSCLPCKPTCDNGNLCQLLKLDHCLA